MAPKVPADVLFQICSHCSLDDIMKISHICVEWRFNVINASSLWSKLSLTIDRDRLEDQKNLMQLSLSRSRSLPLVLALKYPLLVERSWRAEFMPLFTILASTADRWKTVSFSLHSVLMRLLAYLTRKTPLKSLEKIELEYTNPVADPVRWVEGFTRADSAVLRAVNIDGYFIGLPQLPYEQLVSLEIASHPVRPGDLSLILRRSPNLLFIGHWAVRLPGNPSSTPPIGEIFHPRLRSYSIYSSTEESILGCIPYLHLPSLVEIFVYLQAQQTRAVTDEITNSIRDLIVRSKCNLIQLSLFLRTSFSSNLSALLQETPDLETIALNDLEEGTLFDSGLVSPKTVAANYFGSYLALCPRLKQLMIQTRLARAGKVTIGIFRLKDCLFSRMSGDEEDGGSLKVCGFIHGRNSVLADAAAVFTHLIHKAAP